MKACRRTETGRWETPVSLGYGRLYRVPREHRLLASAPRGSLRMECRTVGAGKSCTCQSVSVQTSAAFLPTRPDYSTSLDRPGRYRGLRGGQVVSIMKDDLSGLLVRANVARKQEQAETPLPAGAAAGASAGSAAPPGTTDGGTSSATGAAPAASAPTKPKRFHGTVTLDPTRVGRDAGRIADEVIAHLAGLVGSQVTVTLEVEAEVPSGVPDSVVRTVTENSRTLKFTSQGFEVE
jgi:hypothetical protein